MQNMHRYMHYVVCLSVDKIKIWWLNVYLCIEWNSLMQNTSYICMIKTFLKYKFDSVNIVILHTTIDIYQVFWSTYKRLSTKVINYKYYLQVLTYRFPSGTQFKFLKKIYFVNRFFLISFLSGKHNLLYQWTKTFLSFPVRDPESQFFLK